MNFDGRGSIDYNKKKIKSIGQYGLISETSNNYFSHIDLKIYTHNTSLTPPLVTEVPVCVYMCIRGIHFATVSTIFLIDFVTRPPVPTVWFFFYSLFYYYMYIFSYYTGAKYGAFNC